jgi:predicted MPP superfamily phosphohydrolase
VTASAPETVESPPLVARRARMSRFLRVLIGITVGLHLPVALGVADAARRLGWPQPALIGWGWALAGVLLFAGRVRAAMPDRRGRSQAVVRFFDIPYFVHWCAAVWTLIPAVVATILAPLVDLVRGHAMSLPVDAYMVAYFSGLVVCGYGVLVRRRWVRVVEREVAITGLDPRLEGMRIAHLSDLHIGTMTPLSWGLSWARSANAKAPDVTVVTGDMVTSGTDFHGDVADVIGALRAPGGVFASMGNHDYFGEGEPLVTLLRARGVTLLRNEGVVIERNGAKIWMAAIDDTWTRRDDIASAMRHRPADTTAVLLAHDPNRFDAAAEAGADLVLSGHTHGGQIALPFVPRVNFASFGYPYNIGIYRRNRSVLYVHPGLGTTGPPIRIGAAPEVTILVLKALKPLGL